MLFLELSSAYSIAPVEMTEKAEKTNTVGVNDLEAEKDDRKRHCLSPRAEERLYSNFSTKSHEEKKKSLTLLIKRSERPLKYVLEYIKWIIYDFKTNGEVCKAENDTIENEKIEQKFIFIDKISELNEQSFRKINNLIKIGKEKTREYSNYNRNILDIYDFLWFLVKFRMKKSQNVREEFEFGIKLYEEIFKEHIRSYKKVNSCDDLHSKTQKFEDEKDMPSENCDSLVNETDSDLFFAKRKEFWSMFREYEKEMGEIDRVDWLTQGMKVFTDRKE